MKGLIMEHTADGVYIMTQAGDFKFVKGHTHLPVGSEITLKAALPLPYRRIIAAVACLAVILASATAALWNTERFAVFVDINPSFQVSFNMFDRVQAVEPLNAEAEVFLRGLKVEGSYREALGTVMAAVEGLAAEAGHQEGGRPYVQLTIAAKQQKAQDECYKQVNDYICSLHSDAVVANCTPQERATAQSYGISPGKLQMAEAALRYLPGDDLDSVVQMSTAELYLSVEEGDALVPRVQAARTSLDTATAAAQHAQSAALSAQTSAQGIKAIEMSVPDDNRQAQMDALAQGAQQAFVEAQAAALEAEGAAQAAKAEADIAAQGESIVAQALAQEAEGLAQEALTAAQAAAGAAEAAAAAAAETQAALQREAERLAEAGSDNSSSSSGSPGGQNSGNGNGNANSSSSSGSPGGQNSGNGNGSDNSSSNNGSPGGQNSGNGNGSDNSSSSSGSPGGQNSGNGNN